MDHRRLVQELHMMAQKGQKKYDTRRQREGPFKLAKLVTVH